MGQGSRGSLVICRVERMMRALFLSASVPIEGRGNFFEDADPFLIQHAVRELVTVALGRRRIVWGGHPAITPMIWAVCSDLGVEYSDAVVLYQSKFFKDFFPKENAKFANVQYIGEQADLKLILAAMREAMLSRDDIDHAVFIGGMEGVLDEYNLFLKYHPTGAILPVSSPGGAARQLAEKLGLPTAELEDLDFARLFYGHLEFRRMSGVVILNESDRRDGFEP